MVRPWRIEFDGGYYHVLSRGNERREIYLDDKDRAMFLLTTSGAATASKNKGWGSGLEISAFP